MKIGSLLWRRAVFFLQNGSLLTWRAKLGLFFALKRLSYEGWHQNGAPKRAELRTILALFFFPSVFYIESVDFGIEDLRFKNLRFMPSA